MHQYYLVRRIMPDNCQPTFQLVFSDSDRQKVENHLQLISQNEKLASHKFASYSIELHPAWITPQELNRRQLTRDRKEKESAKLQTTESDRTWADYDEELMSEAASQPNL
jgi:hypothetical protein